MLTMTPTGKKEAPNKKLVSMKAKAKVKVVSKAAQKEETCSPGQGTCHWCSSVVMPLESK